ncbi:hypothetical protein ACGFR8_36865 [Streptomyces brevispora]|uniref:hypothetical protein n=1 Tax=Streptomyces brevispora TaxID=887462 RepID=UPI003710CABA
MSRATTGGMGQVYLGESPAGWLVAVKVIKPSVLDEDSRARFPLEVDSLKAVYGPFIASFVAADTHAERPWPAVEFVQGADLLVHVSEHGPLPLVEAASLGALLAEGLGTVHDATNDMADEAPSQHTIEYTPMVRGSSSLNGSTACGPLPGRW